MILKFIRKYFSILKNGRFQGKIKNKVFDLKGFVNQRML